MTIDEIIVVLQGMREGKAVQRQSKHGGWFDCGDPLWDLYFYNFRLKPEPLKPREWWIVDARFDGSRAFECLSDAEAYAKTQREENCLLPPIVHVHEVLPPEQ